MKYYFVKIWKKLYSAFSRNRDLKLRNFEEHVGNNISSVREFFRDKDIIGEITVVVKGIKKSDFNPDKLIIKKDLNVLINAGLSLSAASKYLSKRNGLKKSEIYNMI